MTITQIAQAMVWAQHRLQQIAVKERARISAPDVLASEREPEHHRLALASLLLSEFEPANDCAFHPEPVPA